MVVPEKKCREKTTRKSKRRSSELESDDVGHVKQIKMEEVTSQLVSQPSPERGGVEKQWSISETVTYNLNSENVKILKVATLKCWWWEMKNHQHYILQHVQ